jgi:hypothetical protein
MLVASAISLRLDICSARSIGMQGKLPWPRTSDDDHSACRSMGALPASGTDRHATCETAWLPPASGVDRAH